MLDRFMRDSPLRSEEMHKPAIERRFIALCCITFGQIRTSLPTALRSRLYFPFATALQPVEASSRSALADTSSRVSFVLSPSSFYRINSCRSRHVRHDLFPFDLFFLQKFRVRLGAEPHFGCFCALSEPSVRFRINGLRFLFHLTRKRSLVRVQSCVNVTNICETETPSALQ